MKPSISKLNQDHLIEFLVIQEKTPPSLISEEIKICQRMVKPNVD